MCGANEQISKFHPKRDPSIIHRKAKASISLSHLPSREKRAAFTKQNNTFVMKIYSAVLPCACTRYQNGTEKMRVINCERCQNK